MNTPTTEPVWRSAKRIDTSPAVRSRSVTLIRPRVYLRGDRLVQLRVPSVHPDRVAARLPHARFDPMLGLWGLDDRDQALCVLAELCPVDVIGWDTTGDAGRHVGWWQAHGFVPRTLADAPTSARVHQVGALTYRAVQVRSAAPSPA